MYKVYSKNGELKLVSHSETLDNTWILECETNEQNYIQLNYQSVIDWCDSRLSDIDKKADRPKRELALAAYLGTNADYAAEMLMNLEVEAEYVREVRKQNLAKLEALL